MITYKTYNLKTTLVTVLTAVLVVSCTRDFEILEPATYSTTAEVFLDGFSGGLDYAAFGESNKSAFEVVKDVKYKGSESMRFDIPNGDDPDGAFAAGFIHANSRRDLSGYEALTFWAKATEPASIDEIGFGFTFEEEKYKTHFKELSVTTSWKKYIIPLPDASKLIAERGMFYYIDAAEDGKGYTFWVDEVKYEKLGTIAHPKPAILEGQDQVISAETGDKLTIGGIFSTFNMPNGADQRVEVAPSYFTLSSTATSVAMVSELGEISVIDSGSVVITAKLGDLDAMGSLTINSAGAPVRPVEPAPTPTVNADSVISMFSNAYTDVPVDTWNTGWQFSTAELQDIQINGDDVKRYKNLNFVGIEFSSQKVDATGMTHFHMDIWSPDPSEVPKAFKVQLVDFGADDNFGGGDDSSHELSFTSPTLVTEAWVSIDVPLSAFSGLTARGNLAQMILSGDLPNVFVDNVYFYIGGDTGGPTAPMDAAPAPTQNEANVISLFSDSYPDVSVDTWRTDWSAATLEDVTIEGNATKKYSAMDFVGIETVSSPVDAAAMTHLRMDVWSSDFTFFGIKLVDFGGDGTFGGGDDVEHQVNFEMPAQGGWVSYDIPLSDFADLSTRGSIGQFILSGQPTGATTVYVDNVYFYDEGGVTPTEPGMAAPTPSQDTADVISLFSDAYTDVSVDTWRTDWSAATLEDLTVEGNATKKYSEMDFVGIETVSSTVDATAMTHLRMDVWSADFTFFGIKLVDLGADGVFGGGNDVEHQINFEMPAQGSWISYDIPLTDFTGLTTRGHIGQYIIVGQPTGTTTVYVDNIYFYSEGGSAPTVPSMAAPTPTQDTADVISLFSDAYTNVGVDTWRTDWSAATLEDVTVEGNATKKYSALDFVGIETVTGTVDASDMTHFRMDVWSADFTFFGVKLVDFGADGIIGGGDDVEHQVNFEMPAQGAWISYDIPLSDFTGLTTRGQIGQYILVGQPTGAITVFVDNVYFYK